MKRIFVIYTGGTICTTVQDGKIGIDPAAPSTLIEFYRKEYTADTEFVKGEFFGILSENMTVEKWNLLCNYVKANLEKLKTFDGIIISHGTDTLAYSAALFSILLKGFSVPVFFVSSNKSIINPDGSRNAAANGIENFAAAVELIEKGISPNVYVTYKNPSDNKTYLHLGENIKQCEIYSDDFKSANMFDLSAGCPNFEIQKTDNIALPLLSLKKPLTDCVLKIEPYVGLNYSRFNLDGVKAILHTTYHSGTACVDFLSENDPSDSSVLSLIDRAAKENVPFYFAPAKSGEEQSVYASVPFIEHRAKYGTAPILSYGETTETLYAKLLIKYSQE